MDFQHFDFKNLGLLEHLVLVFIGEGSRYIIFSGGAYLLYYVIKKQEWFFAKIQQKHPKSKQIFTEIKYTLLTLLTWAVMGSLISSAVKHFNIPIKIYTDIHEHSYLYAAFTFAAFFFIHDTYFYWTHRLIHHPKIYKYAHRAHHLSTSPTPFAVMAFHPIEAIVNGGIALFVFFLFPLHIGVAIAAGSIYFLYNVMGHLGFEIYPHSWAKHSVFKYLNNATAHDMHHKYVNGNYSLYFTIWDRAMGTLHEKYEETFEEVTTRRDEGLKELKAKKMSVA